MREIIGRSSANFGRKSKYRGGFHRDWLLWCMNVLLLWASSSVLDSGCDGRCWSSVLEPNWYSWWMYFGMPCCSLWLTCTRVVPRGGSVPGGGYFGTVDGGRTYLGWYSFFLPSMLHFLLRQHILSGRVFLIGPPHKYFMSFLAGCRTAFPRLLAFLPAWRTGWLDVYLWKTVQTSSCFRCIV